MRDSIHIYLGQTRIATRLKMDDSSDYEYSRLNTYYYHSDHLGSAQLVTDYAGEEYEHMEYTPYGELWLERNRDGSDLIPFRFTGKEFDTETNLYYYGARYMDPRTNRWISSDPAGAMLASPMGDGGKPRQNFSLIESMNHYSYVSNNPLKYTDPTGMRQEEDATEILESAKPEVGSEDWINQMHQAAQNDYQQAMEQEFANTLRSLRGIPYKYNGDSEEGADCSGIIILALEKMGFRPGDYSAQAMGDGSVPWIEIQEKPVSQGDPGILNFYTWGSKSIQHVNAGVGYQPGERRTQVIDATQDGTWTQGRNANPLQIYPASPMTINQTFVPFSTRTKPDVQGRINFNAIPR
jgi:RHS repeat-associated protein